MQKHNNLQLTDDQYLSLTKARDLVNFYLWLTESGHQPNLEVNIVDLSASFSVVSELLNKGLEKASGSEA